jgi:hypothetical protein
LWAYCLHVHPFPSIMSTWGRHQRNYACLKQEYEVCLQTSDYPTGECAKEERWNNELHALDFRTD